MGVRCTNAESPYMWASAAILIFSKTIADGVTLTDIF